jgi:hypothetical protein
MAAAVEHGWVVYEAFEATRRGDVRMNAGVGREVGMFG